MTYKPPLTITPKMLSLVIEIGEHLGRRLMDRGNARMGRLVWFGEKFGIKFGRNAAIGSSWNDL